MARIFPIKCVLIITLSFAPALAAAFEIQPYKDKLFAYPAISGASGNPLDLTIEYQELRDINGRDEIPERKVKRAYVSLTPRKAQRDVKIPSPSGALQTIVTGTAENARFIVVYLHGQGGTRHQGSNDYTFGGNFNRIKNLAFLNGGLYLTPDFSDFGDAGAMQVIALLRAFLATSPDAKLVVACGSMGGFVCHRIAQNTGLSNKLSGMLFLGSFGANDLKTSPAFMAGMRVFIGHGSDDATSPLSNMEAFADDLRKANDKSQVMMHRFASGTHGTPVRMTDWRLVLNWMFAR